MVRYLRILTLAGTILCSAGASAQAQWGYPMGFGPYSWGGWGASTPMGDEAHGLGIFAAGAGQYNLQTAKANSINLDTVMRFNEYIWESRQTANRIRYRRQADQRQRVNERVATTYARLRDNPERADIHRGDALNVILDELSAPGIYSRSISAAQAPLATTLVKSLPFRYAPQAICISLDELANRVPAVIKDPSFDKERLALQQIVAKARTESEADDQLPVETLRSVRAAIRQLHDRIRSDVPVGRNRTDAENFLKAAYGLARMMETPEISTFLKELDRIDTTSLASLLGFMFAFNLRFGVATTPSQRTAYDELFTKLRAVRDQLFPKDDAPLAIGAPVRSHPEWAREFFSGMALDEVQEKKPLMPGNPAHGR
jgi:hypothetical protein